MAQWWLDRRHGAQDAGVQVCSAHLWDDHKQVMPAQYNEYQDTSIRSPLVAAELHDSIAEIDPRNSRREGTHDASS